MSRIPRWAIKPVLKNAEVIATDRGWEKVNEGKPNELLVVHKDLDKHLAELKAEVEQTVGALDVTEETETVVVTDAELEDESAE